MQIKLILIREIIYYIINKVIRYKKINLIHPRKNILD